MVLPIVFIVALLCGVVAGSIADSRQGRGFGLYFFLGFFFGIFGILIAAFSQPTPTPPGWYADPWNEAAWRWYDGYQWTYLTNETL